MEQPSNVPFIQGRILGGLNERESPANLNLQEGRPIEWSALEGLYPSQNGLLSRIPGKNLLAVIPSNSAILQITPTYNHFGDILIQTNMGRFAYTLDQLLGRETVPNLDAINVEEEAMGLALMFHEEANGVSGGSIGGWVSGGPDNASSPQQFYPRRLTVNQTNQSSTLSGFSASTGGAGGPSSGGTFTVVPGNYRIEAEFLFGVPNTPMEATVGLWNTAGSGAFQLDDGSGIGASAEPIISTALNSSSSSANFSVKLMGRFVVAGSPSTFQIMQAVNTQGSGNTTNARSLTACGNPSSGVTATVNTALPKMRYGWVKILQEPS